MDPDDGRRRREVLIQEAIRTRPLGLRRFLFRRASRDRDSACHCSLNLLAQFSLGRRRIGVCDRAAHLPARPVGFGSLGHQKALPPSFLLFSGLWSSRSAQRCTPASRPRRKAGRRERVPSRRARTRRSQKRSSEAPGPSIEEHGPGCPRHRRARWIGAASMIEHLYLLPNGFRLRALSDSS